MEEPSREHGSAADTAEELADDEREEEGRSRYREVPHPFGSWTSEDRTMRVFFGLDHNGQRRGEARVAEESRERIVVALTRLEPVGYTTLIGGIERHHADLRLREPVGERAVIDASAGVARQSLDQLGNR